MKAVCTSVSKKQNSICKEGGVHQKKSGTFLFLRYLKNRGLGVICIGNTE